MQIVSAKSLSYKIFYNHFLTFSYHFYILRDNYLVYLCYFWTCWALLEACIGLPTKYFTDRMLYMWMQQLWMHPAIQYRMFSNSISSLYPNQQYCVPLPLTVSTKEQYQRIGEPHGGRGMFFDFSPIKEGQKILSKT